MALTPQNSEAFLREVDEELRREQLGSFWKRWGVAIVAAVVLGLAGLAFGLWWQHHRAEQAGLASEAMSGALDDLDAGKPTAAKAALTDLSKGSRPGYAALARLALAAQADQAKDPAAAAQFKAIADDGGVAEPIRQLALVRQTAAEFDRIAPAEVVRRMQPLMVAGEPWHGTAGELTGLAQAKLGQTKQAGQTFAAVARDTKVPASIRSRAARIASSLGAEPPEPDQTATTPALGE